MSDDQMSILVADFGEAILTEYSIRTSVAGTLLYMAPERIKLIPVALKSDLWSCGVIIYEMIHLKLPFNDLKEILEKKEIYFDRTINIAKDLEPLLVE